jgi:hypothetical protein
MKEALEAISHLIMRQQKRNLFKMEKLSSDKTILIVSSRFQVEAVWNLTEFLRGSSSRQLECL